jgi:hypothetical protein
VPSKLKAPNSTASAPKRKKREGKKEGTKEGRREEGRKEGNKTLLCFVLFCFAVLGLNSGPTPSVTPPVLFCDGFF